MLVCFVLVFKSKSFECFVLLIKIPEGRFPLFNLYNVQECHRSVFLNLFRVCLYKSVKVRVIYFPHLISVVLLFFQLIFILKFHIFASQ